MRRYLFLAYVSMVAFSQEVPKPAESPQTSSAIDYRLGASDVVSIKVIGLTDFDRSVTVSNSGRIRLPHVGVINVLDKTTSQLEEDLARRLRDRNLIKDAWVQVQVISSRSRTIYVLGEVGMPGQYLVKDGMRLLDLVSLGLGLNDVTSNVVYLYRPRPVEPETLSKPNTRSAYEVAHIDLHQLLRGKNAELNVVLRGGDILYCPEKIPDYFYVVGDLVKTGPIEMVSGQTVMASHAISWAGGPTRTAKLSEGIVLRYDKNGARQELAVDFKALLAGKEPDFSILPSDIIFVPGSSAKTLTYGLLGIIPGVAMMVAIVP